GGRQLHRSARGVGTLRERRRSAVSRTRARPHRGDRCAAQGAAACARAHAGATSLPRSHPVKRVLVLLLVAGTAHANVWQHAIEKGQPYPHDIALFDRKHALEIVDAWNKFEERAPLDPRLSIHINETEILFRRALLETKLADKPHLEAAAHDYEKMIDRADPGSDTLNDI